MEWLQGYTFLWVLVAAGLFLAANIDLAVYFLEQQSRRKYGYPPTARPVRIVIEMLYAGACLLTALVVVLFWTIPRVWKGALWMFTEHWFLTSFLIALVSITLHLLLSRYVQPRAATPRQQALISRASKLALTPLVIVGLIWLWDLLSIAWIGIKTAARSVWYVLWDLPLQINDLPPFNGEWPFVGYTLRWLIIVALAAIVVVGAIQFVYWFISKRRARQAQREQPAAAPLQRFSDHFHAILYTIPFQHSAGVFWNFFGRGGVAWTVDEGFHVKFPWIQIVDIVDRQQRDLEFTTEQLPAGRITPAQLKREKTAEAYADEALKQLEAARGRERRVSGTLSYVLRATVAIRSAKMSADYDDGVRAIFRSSPEYRDLRSTQVRERFTDLISARLRETIALMPFEDAFFVPPMILLLGSSTEMVGRDLDDEKKPLIGIKRWSRYLDASDNEAHEKGFAIELTRDRWRNLFKIDLNDPDQVVKAITLREHSLLATFFTLGYKLTRFGIKDINPPTGLQEKLARLVSVELERDAKITEYASQFVDKATAERGERNIQADASNYTFRVFLEEAKAAFDKYNPGKGELFAPTQQEIMQFMRFLEDRRTRRLMAEKEGRYIQMDISPEAPVPTSFAPFAMVAGLLPQTPPRAEATPPPTTPPASGAGGTAPKPAAQEPKT